MPADIRVKAAGPGAYDVEVQESKSKTSHRVRVSDENLRAWGAGRSAEELVEESFRFLLENEPKESILRTFDLPVIARYFPEYPTEITRRMKQRT